MAVPHHLHPHLAIKNEERNAPSTLKHNLGMFILSMLPYSEAQINIAAHV